MCLVLSIHCLILMLHFLLEHWGDIISQIYYPLKTGTKFSILPKRFHHSLFYCQRNVSLPFGSKVILMIDDPERQVSNYLEIFSFMIIWSENSRSPFPKLPQGHFWLSSWHILVSTQFISSSYSTDHCWKTTY